MSSPTARVLAALGLMLLGYLAFLGWMDHQPGADLVVVVQAGPAGAPPLDPATGRRAWSSPEGVAAEVERLRDTRETREFVHLRADADALHTQWLELDGRRILLAQAPAAAHGAVLALARGADLLIVATPGPVAPYVEQHSGPLAVLPGAFGPGVPGGVQAEAEGRLVAPWVDSRHRLGELQVHWGEGPPGLQARTVRLRDEAAQGDEPTALGVGGAHLAQDLVRQGQGGLAGALAAEMRARTGAELALLNLLSVRGGLEGPATLGQVRAALPFQNQVVLLSLSGDVLAALLAENAQANTRYLVAAGVTQDPEGAWRWGDGALVGGAQQHLVATVDYLADGGRGNRPGFLTSPTRVNTGLTTEGLALDLLEPPNR